MRPVDATPRDLLFGLIALQVGLIDQDRLILAFTAWSRGKIRSLAEILVEQGTIDPESRSLLEAMSREAGLDSIRARPDFRHLMHDLAFPVDVFAK